MSLTTELLLRWHQGDEQGLSGVLERHLEWIRTAVSRELGPGLRAKLETGDVVQEALLEFLRYGPKVRPVNGAQFRAVMVRIIANALRDRYDWFKAKRRDMAREKPLSSESTIDLAASTEAKGTPDAAATQNELEARIRLVIELMPPEDRQVLLLKDWDGLTFVEIGAQLQISADAARMRYQRALPRLKSGLRAVRAGGIESLLDVVP